MRPRSQIIERPPRASRIIGYRRCICIGLACLSLTVHGATRGLPDVAPNLDPRKLVNRSLNFLREREPEMNEVEYALYTRMIPIVESTPELALELLETMLSDDKPESAAFEFVLGNVYFALERMEGAEEHFLRAVEQHPSFLRAWVNLASVYYATGRFREAIPCFAKAISLGDREASTFGLMASALRESGNTFAAETAYKQAMTSEPGNPDWINGLLEIYLKTEQHAPAAALARELLQSQPDDPRNWTLYSGLLVVLERRDEAIAVLQAGADLGLISPQSWHVLGDLYAAAGLPREAAAAYARGGEDTDDERVFIYVRALLQERRFEQAEKVLADLDRSAGSHPSPALLRARAELARERGDPAAARRELEAALRLDPLHGSTLLALAGLHLEAKEFAHAELLYEQAAQQPESEFAARVELAQLALRDHRHAEAIEHARAAQAIRPSDDLQEFITRIRTLADFEPAAKPDL